MQVIKLTSKRQATFPKKVCQELGVACGDELRIHKRTIDGNPVWILEPNRPSTAWFGSLRRYAGDNTHDVAAIKKSIAEAIGKAGR